MTVRNVGIPIARAALLALLLAASAASSQEAAAGRNSGAPEHAGPAYLDPSLPTATRVDDLISRMTPRPCSRRQLALQRHGTRPSFTAWRM